MTLLGKIEARLVADWRQAWKWSSVRVAVLAGAIAGWAASDPNGFSNAVDLLPPWARPLLGMAVTTSAILSRISSVKAKNDG